MISRYIKPRDEALTSDDLAVCQKVLDAVKAEFKFADDEEEVSRSAAIIIELYRQGVHDEEQLKTLVFATRGKI
ncbi:hypothetical protein FHT78_002057 [Rhizobium sp. BK196]|jgi:hypothetical protein|uniref:hypothetical protein n=1 Tax=unclassified Rhizobium TaxID=2613769 RepID=UPI00160BC9C8|nr:MULTISPECIES: hypothetical protein [unclassified Rhizobium]MBB3310314.1 hypothetical protein [Rhizobium sp. BK196]MBB3464902.1 hypothetical protein [Rhizobium sp. BK377]